MAFPVDPVTIGPTTFSPALALAPLHEITDPVFRRAVRGIGGLGLTVSEMVSCEALIRHAPKARRMLEGDGGRPYAVQLCGADPAHMAEAARLALAADPDFLDLNMGCPASNVTRSGAGSALLRDLARAERIVAAVVSAVPVPVTVKMRTGWDAAQQGRREFLDFIRMYRDQGVRALTIHPRTRAQQYTGHADWSLIALAVDAVQGAFPVIGNGDVTSADLAGRMVQETGCDVVMIGRAATTNPWIFRQVLEPGLAVTEQDRIAACLRFFRQLVAEVEPREALHKMKKLGSWFTRGIPGGAAFRQKLQGLDAPEALLAELEALLDPAGTP